MSSNRRKRREQSHSWDAILIASLVLVVLSILLGGASRDHALRLAVVELAALPLITLGASRLIRTGAWQEHRFALLIMSLIVALPLLQLIPLPPAIWSGLPGRGDLAIAQEIAGIRPGMSPLSLTPDLTWRAALALCPPLALFLAVLSSPSSLSPRVTYVYLALAAVSVLLGIAQLASGGERLYPWATTSAGSVTGFFANRNHLATFLLCLLPFTIMLGASTFRRRHADRLPLWFAAVFTGVIIVALAAIRSRAGVILFAPVITCSMLAAWVAAGRGRPSPALLAMIGVTGAALTAVAALALPPLLARFDSQSAPEGRFERWPIVAEAAQSYLPVGSGIGSFDSVYRSVEPLAQLDRSFFNQAHNEYLEVWLEAGWPGIALIILFFVWYARRTVSAWKGQPSRVRDVQRAASIAIGAVLLHSIGDYPLRTVAMAVLFAFCCGLLEFAKQPDTPR